MRDKSTQPLYRTFNIPFGCKGEMKYVPLTNSVVIFVHNPKPLNQFNQFLFRNE